MKRYFLFFCSYFNCNNYKDALYQIKQKIEGKQVELKKKKEGFEKKEPIWEETREKESENEKDDGSAAKNSTIEN